MKKWKEVLELAEYFAEVDYLSGIEPWSWEKKGAVRELEDALRMNSIWHRYSGTDEEYDVIDFFVKEYNKELERLWNENAE